MSNSKKKTGLGKSAFFTPQAEESESPTPPAETTKAEEPKAPEKPQKVRTTVTLYPETLAAMELLKANARKSGKKVTLSDVFEDAIKALMEKKQITV